MFQLPHFLASPAPASSEIAMFHFPLFLAGSAPRSCMEPRTELLTPM